jgi:HSP20 family molecular chaperone IbpA
MRYIPERSLFDDFFHDAFTNDGGSVMRTDVYKKDGTYTMCVELPGFRKEDIRLSLFNGVLKITANHNETKEEKDAKGEVLRSERLTGAVARSFYVGETLKDTDLHASYENGVLTVSFPTPERKEAESRKYINID